MSMGGKWFRLGAQARQSMEYFGVNERSVGGLRLLTLKGGGPIRGDKLMVGLTSPPQLDTKGIEVRLMSG